LNGKRKKDRRNQRCRQARKFIGSVSVNRVDEKTALPLVEKTPINRI